MDSPIDLAGAAAPGVRRQRFQALTIRTAAGRLSRCSSW